MNFNDLPTEMIRIILSFLRPSGKTILRCNDVGNVFVDPSYINLRLVSEVFNQNIEATDPMFIAIDTANYWEPPADTDHHDRNIAQWRAFKLLRTFVAEVGHSIDDNVGYQWKVLMYLLFQELNVKELGKRASAIKNILMKYVRIRPDNTRAVINALGECVEDDNGIITELIPCLIRDNDEFLIYTRVHFWYLTERIVSHVYHNAFTTGTFAITDKKLDKFEELAITDFESVDYGHSDGNILGNKFNELAIRFFPKSAAEYMPIDIKMLYKWYSQKRDPHLKNKVAKLLENNEKDNAIETIKYAIYAYDIALGGTTSPELLEANNGVLPKETETELAELLEGSRNIKLFVIRWMNDTRFTDICSSNATADIDFSNCTNYKLLKELTEKRVITIDLLSDRILYEKTDGETERMSMDPDYEECFRLVDNWIQNKKKKTQ